MVIENNTTLTGIGVFGERGQHIITIIGVNKIVNQTNPFNYICLINPMTSRHVIIDNYSNYSVAGGRRVQ